MKSRKLALFLKVVTVTVIWESTSVAKVVPDGVGFGFTARESELTIMANLLSSVMNTQ